MAQRFPGDVIPVALRRDGYVARGAFAWIRPSEYGIAAAEQGRPWLHANEQGVFRSLKVERRQISYLLGRLAAKSALGACVGAGFSASATEISSGVFSQPVVQGRFDRAWAVSISHSERLVCGLAFPEEHPMAIDVEHIDPSRTTVMQSQMGPDERARVQAVCGSADLAATVIWTAKEALSKALRCGMTCPFQLLEVDEFEQQGDVFFGRFKNFAQYKFRAWRRRNTVVTVVFPKKTELELSFPDLMP